MPVRHTKHSSFLALATIRVRYLYITLSSYIQVPFTYGYSLLPTLIMKSSLLVNVVSDTVDCAWFVLAFAIVLPLAVQVSVAVF